MASRNEILSLLKEILNFYASINNEKYNQVKKVLAKDPDFTTLRLYTPYKLGFWDTLKLLFSLGKVKKDLESKKDRLREISKEDSTNAKTREILTMALEIMDK